MTQISLFDIALPEVFTVGAPPKSDGVYRCRVKKSNGEFEFMNLECVNSSFKLEDGKVIYWR